MRGFNNKIKSVYQELTNSKEKFGSFYKTLIHLHTPVSYDYKLFSNWTATKYRKITEDELYPQLFTPLCFFAKEIEVTSPLPIILLLS